MPSASVSSGNGGTDGFTSDMPSGMLIAYNHGGSPNIGWRCLWGRGQSDE
jgi:hypothetical protein